MFRRTVVPLAVLVVLGAVVTTAAAQVPVPELLSPAEGAVLDNGRIDRLNWIAWDFDWSDCAGATHYHLYVKHPSALNPVIDASELTQSSFHHACMGCYVGDTNRFGWTWKVRAEVDGVWGAWSPVRTFDVEPVNTDRPNVFTDVPDDQWALDEIMAAYLAGIVAGYPDGTYDPDGPVTRDQMAVFLVRALGEEPDNPEDPQSWLDAYGYDPAEPTTWEVDFTDIPATGWGDEGGPHWAWFHIQRLYALGVTKGISETQYGPTIDVSRDQMAVFLIRALGLECADPCEDASCWPYDPAEPSTWPHEFGDVPATGQGTCHGAHWAWFHIQALYETGVTLGCGDGSNYCPAVAVRRDEMAAFLARAFLGM